MSDLSRRAGIATLLLGLLLRFVVPVGYMMSPDGALAVVPCPSAGQLLKAKPSPEPVDDAMAAMPGHHMAMHGGHHGDGPVAPAHGDPSQHAANACPFAALSVPGTLPDPPFALPRVDPITAGSAAILHLVAAVARLSAPPPPARGPPPLS